MLGDYESGAKMPSRPLLVKMAKHYRRPLVTFYLEYPPKRGERGEDFRTLPIDKQHESAARLDALVRDVFVRQRMVQSILEDAEAADPNQLVGSIGFEVSVPEAARKISQVLQFDLLAFRRRRNIDDAFAYLRKLTEDLGIFVLLIGNLGTHHTALSTEVFRGFALADPVAPFIVINDQDAKVAWSFTLLHELAHIALGRTGVSGVNVEHQVEQRCNDIASEILLPALDLAELIQQVEGGGDLVTLINTFAGNRKLSRPLVAYRLLKSRMISHEQWQQLNTRYAREWDEDKARRKEKAAQAESGPNYYVVRRHRVGQALVDVIRWAMAEGFTTPTKAGRVLGVRPNNVEALVGAN
ncbi:hypothetical protein PCO31111_01428 [Pandoraea communis]|uniref:IrrE N-terminal-like domain-containing protein n=1 Tax=Pandoraea communis TaxID=2508297 RepID=A0A5E4TKG8_9BURK|nr:ImmA/IrrE family metallo-endopeptidase [Pandoraea communis]VVD87018.1 hypothetical protein PCO31111_01428 [Pandoraea communis]